MTEMTQELSQAVYQSGAPLEIVDLDTQETFAVLQNAQDERLVEEEPYDTVPINDEGRELLAAQVADLVGLELNDCLKAALALS
jgi:hypothetical protein